MSAINLLFPLGHFYSPIADPNDIRAREIEIWDEKNEMSGIDMNILNQLKLLNKLKSFALNDNYPVDKTLDQSCFYYNNDQYTGLDADFLYAAICYFRPRNMSEVGSGYSSLITAEVNRSVFKNSLNFCCIEPYPRQFLVNGVEGITSLIRSKVEGLNLTFFDRLNSGDILFIDSSHVSKIGSDVNYLFFEVLPRLKKGVIVHVHDVFLPDEYPKVWMIEQGRNWNEQYLLRAFMQYNKDWEILWMAFFMASRYSNEVASVFRNFPKLGGGGSFWMRRI